ncbi:hypothetical protein E4K67_28025 [Desulfosporosinus fructosivorans]|uniref:Uncharacterized protein n=1 Tax=Desulfosporosinus fructosivorans TaxID=2018669 RepID=A0A4Z0QY33_9FIRM|nr:hypothetical protein [Desulfosporosinus fructosivorans]TGE34935.1 hypothetical protein E4K67_28025 [Desulfosporosinus fructosivorans]
MFKDKILIGAVIGILADSLKLITNYTFWVFGFTKVVFWQIVATRFIQKEYLYHKLAYIVGAIADITFTSLLGIVFVYVIYLFGPKNLWTKGVGFGLVVWVIVFGTLLGQTVEDKLPQEPTGVVITLIAHIVFGFALAFFTKVLDQDKLVLVKRNKLMRTYKSKGE